MMISHPSYRRAFTVIKRLSSTTVGSTDYKFKAVNAVVTPKPGHIHNKIPFKYHCKAGRVYMWCSCGWSRNQPFCDGTHGNRKLKIDNKPVRFECTETGDYWFCQCKQTKDRPFCDGSHEEEPVVSAVKKTIQYET